MPRGLPKSCWSFFLSASSSTLKGFAEAVNDLEPGFNRELGLGDDQIVLLSEERPPL